MTLLSVVQGALREIGDFEVPESLTGSQNQTSIQMVALANREGRELSRRHAWSALVKEHSFDLQNGVDSYSLSSIGLTDLLYPLKRGAWNREAAHRIDGPVTAVGWQALKGAGAVARTGEARLFRIQGQAINVHPTPSGVTAATDTVTIAYVSRNWCTDSGGTPKASLAADDDVMLLDEDLVQMGLVWRFLSAKGLPFDTEQAAYARAVVEAITRDSSGTVLQLDSGRNVIRMPSTPEDGFGL